MNILKNKPQKQGAITSLTLKVSYTACLFSLLLAISSYTYLNNTGLIFNLSVLFFILNLSNTLLYYQHRNLSITYNVLSFLAFGLSFILCLYSGGINSSFTFFLVTIVFAGFLTNSFYGKLWFVIIAFSIGALYILNVFNIEFINYIPQNFKAEFNLFFIIFLMILYGGIFGRIITKNRARFRKTKRTITHQNQEKSVMLKEIHHRVKNNLQIINSLLQIQSRDIDDPKTKMIFKAAQNRIVAMGGLHERIYNTKNLKYIDVKEHFEQLINDLIKSYEVETNITLVLKIDKINMPIETLLPLCLIINELISNSLKHAFKNHDTGIIELAIKDLKNKQYELTLKDNGLGIPKSKDTTHKQSTGLKLTHSFAKQLRGELELMETEKGTAYRIQFSEI